MAQVDIGFDVQLGGKGLTDLEKLQKTLEEIEKRSKIKLSTNSDNGGVETAKERNKLDTIAIQNLQLKQKLIEAENKGYAETQNKLQKLMDINEGIIRQADEIVGKKASEVITKKQWEELKLIEKKESSIRKQKEEEIRLTQEVNKALLENKKVSEQQLPDQYGGFSKSKELEDMKKFYEERDKENKKAQELELQRFNQNLKAKQEGLRQKQKEEYDAIRRHQSLKDRLYSVETDMIRNNLSRERYLKEGEVQKSFQDKLKELQNNKNLREQDLKEFEKYMKRASAINQANRSNFTSDISQLMVVRQMKANVERTTLTMEKFEDAVYQAGIIGGKTGVEIRQLRNEMTQLGREIPRATQEIVEQIGSVARTGRTFEEAVKIVTNASNLAIVSGEKLADSVNVLNNVMVAFDINIANTAKTMDILHSATLTTPLDLRAIADGMKNSASAMRNFIENTNKSGEELEDYKTTLLELNTALLGNQMSLGRTASSAGLSIRTLSTKLIAMEKSASALFDKEMMLNSVTVDLAGNLSKQGNGLKLTSDLLGQLAEKDLPKTIELLSQLYNTGELSTKTLSKMFTGRQAPYLIAQLGLMKGNITEYIDGTTKATKVSLDAEKAMENWTYQLKIARNTMTAFATTTSGFMDYVGKDMLKIFNAVTGGMVKMTQSGTFASHSFGVLKDITLAVGLAMASLKLGELTTQFLGLGKAVRSVGDTLVLVRAASGGLEKLRMLFTTGGGWMLALAALAAIVVGITSTINRMNEASRQATIEEIKRNRELDQLNKKMKATEALLLTQVRLYRDIAGMDWTKEWEKGYDIIGATLGKLKEFAELIDVTSKLRVINIDDVDLGVATKLTETIEEKVKDINIKLSEDKEFSKIEKEIERLNKSIKKRQSELKEFKIDNSLPSVRSAIGFNISLTEEEFKDREKIIRSEIQKRVKLEEKMKQILQEEYKPYQQNKLRKIKLSEIGDSNVLRSMKDTNMFDIITKGTFNEAKTLIDYLKQTNHEMTVPASELFNQRLELMSSNLENINKQAETYTNYLNRVNQLYTDIRVEAFTNFLKINPDDIKGLDDYIEKAKEFKIFYEGIDSDQDTTENIIKGFVKELENVGATQFQIDLMVKEDSFLNTLSQYKALTDSVSNLKEGLEGLKKTQAEGGVTELSPEDVSAIWEANKENIIKSGLMTEEEFQKQLENGEKNTLDFIKMIEALLKKAGDTNTIFFKNIFSTLSKEQKKAFTDLFFYYDETVLRELKLQESQQKGIQQIETKRKILAEEMKMSKAKFDFDMSQLKNADKIGILQRKNGENEQKYLKNTLDLLIKRKEEVEKGGVLKEETAEYKDIEKAIKLVQDQQRKLNDEKIKGQEYDKDEKKIIEDTRKYYEELSKSYEELTLAKDISEYDNIKNKEKELKQVVESRSELINSIKDKQSELLQLSQSEKEIDKEKQDELNRELAIYKQILSLVDSITDRLTKQTEVMKNNANSLAEELNELFKSLEYKPARKVANESIEEFKKQYEVTSSSNLYDGKEKIDIKGYKDVINALKQQQEIIDDITVKVGEYKAELSNPTTSEDRKNQLEKELELLEQQLVIEKKINKQGLKTIEDQKKANKELQDSISEIAQLAQSVLSGEGFSFTGGFVSKGLDSLSKLIGSNLEEGFEELTGKDYANIIGLSIETLNANLNRGLEASKQQLELDLLMLDLRKQFLRTEEDINANSREILEKQKKQAELEAMQSTAFMGNTGRGASALGGATQGAVAGATIGGGIGAVIGGALGLFGGILGGSSAKKQAAAQKKQLELQFVANALLDKQNRLIEEMTNAVDKMINTTYLGIERSIKQALEGIVTAPTHTLDLEYRKTRNVGYIGSPHGGAPTLNPADIAYNERAEAHNAKVKDLIESYETLKNMDLSNIGSIGNLSVYDDVGNLVKNATGYLKDIETIIEALHSYDGDREVIDLHISSLVRFQQELLVIKKIAEDSADIFYGSAFGFEIEKVTDSLGNLEGLKIGRWNVREEIIKKFSDGSYSAGQSIAESFVDGFNFNLTIEDDEIQDMLDDIEDSFKESFKLKLEFDDDSIEELRGEHGRLSGELYSISTKLKQNLTPEERAYYMGLQQPLIAEKNKVEDELGTQLQAQRDYNVTLQSIVAKTELLKEAQIKNQESVYETNQLWLESGGSLSDIKNKLSEISKSLYDTLASGDFTALGSTIGNELSKGIADTIKDSFHNIFDLETQINELISSTTNFDDSWLATAKQKMSLGEQFNDLTIEQVKDTNLIRSYLKGIGYEEKDINNELIQQVQKMLSIKILSEEITNSEKESLTLRGMINESQSKLNTLIEQYVTKLYNGTFNEIELNTLLEERNKLLQMETEERLLITSVMVQMAQKGVAINEIMSHLPQTLQEALATLININYALEDTSNELSTADKLWNSQVGSIRDTLKAKLMSAKYSEDLANIDNKVLEIQQAVTSEKEKQIRIDSLQEGISKAKANEKLNKVKLAFADKNNLSQEERQKLQDSINEAKKLQIQLQNELTSVIANKPLETLQQELTGLIEGLGNTLENDTDLKRIDELFADKVLNGDSLTESYKSIFTRLNEQTSKFTETLEFWFRGGLKLIGDDLTEDWKKTIEEVNAEFYKMKELEQSITEDQRTLLELWKDGTIKASLSDIVDKLGNMANTVKTSLTNALSSKGYLNIATTLGNEISQAIATGWNDDIINNKLKDEYVELITQANTAMMSGSLADINKLSMEMQSVASKIEYENIRQQALLDLFNYNAEINYATQNTQIDYSTGTTKENVYNITYNTNVTTGALVTDSFSGAQKITDQLATNIINSLEKHGKKL